MFLGDLFEARSNACKCLVLRAKGNLPICTLQAPTAGHGTHWANVSLPNVQASHRDANTALEVT